MAVTMPKIDVSFKQLATSLISRSERGNAVLIIRDATVTTQWYSFKKLSEVVEEEFSDTNYQYIKDCFAFAPYRLFVARIGSTDTVADATEIIESYLTTGWVTVADMSTTDSADLASWIKSMETEKKTFKGLCYKALVTDSMHIVNFYNDKVTFGDTRGKVGGQKYLPSLVGILASCNITRGCTNYHCANLTSVTEVTDRDAFLGDGKFILYNDVDKVRIALGINSMVTTNGNTRTEDMKYIETVEAMDIISDDISRVFKEEYLGNYRNNLDNQMLFIASINQYFRELARDLVLDNNYPNHAEIDVDSQRSAWLGVGKSEAEEWTDAEVRRNSFKRTVYLLGDIKILGSMENLMFEISMF